MAHQQPHYKHPGGKLRELGPETLDQAELLAILIGTGTKDKTALALGKDIIQRFGSFEALSKQPLEKLLDFKGMGDVKILRIAAALEMARRLAKHDE